MTESTDKKSGETDKPAPVERETRRAEALRANLRRRKSGATKRDKDD